MATKKAARTVSRSAKSGEFVTKKYAESHPGTTEVETVGKSGGKTRQVARSAKSGEFVSSKYAETHPSTTEVETVKRGGKKK